ncbi:MAG TPA: MarR family transcriptional regulator [Streptosporangiaceae bacterium]|jgi:DNA-binding MarR family transcriptional regulator|nr:MarR family transcriptional regulator [Streptosporangiaceae bacterium]
MDADRVTRLRGVIGRLARQLNASSTGEGLTPSQASVLGLVVFRGPLSLAELAEMEGLNPTMLSRVVGRLLELELIQRIPDPADLRSASVVSTPAGKDVDRRVKSQRAAVVSECVDQLTPEQEQALIDALPALDALAEALKKSTRQPAR